MGDVACSTRGPGGERATARLWGLKEEWRVWINTVHAPCTPPRPLHPPVSCPRVSCRLDPKARELECDPPGSAFQDVGRAGWEAECKQGQRGFLGKPARVPVSQDPVAHPKAGGILLRVPQEVVPDHMAPLSPPSLCPFSHVFFS